jgi:hypothetical protein
LKVAPTASPSFGRNKENAAAAKELEVENYPNCRKSGVNVMITIFCDFSQFSAKKLAFFLNTNVMIKNLHNLALFSVKNANFFAEFFGEIIYKNRNIGTWR